MTASQTAYKKRDMVLDRELHTQLDVADKNPSTSILTTRLFVKIESGWVLTTNLSFQQGESSTVQDDSRLQNGGCSVRIEFPAALNLPETDVCTPKLPDQPRTALGPPTLGP